ncbi:MAG: CDP-archaeol synthase, partial [Candidatus Heimdallarchaeota archaeon]|nr:CDP-archaeol synthase [Candidatus Heimdallarchaeota archaeon]
GFVALFLDGSMLDLSPVDFRLEYQKYYTSSIAYDLLNFLNMQALVSDSLILGGISGGVMAFGGMTGDMIGSFIKRRSGIPRGKTFVFLDQLGFLVLGMVLVFPIIPWPIEWLLFLVPITFLTHIVANLLGYITGIQDDPL